MHDELDFSLKTEKQGLEIQELMRTAHILKVPMMVDVEYGTSWGRAAKVELKDKTVPYKGTWKEALRLRKEGPWWTSEAA